MAEMTTETTTATGPVPDTAVEEKISQPQELFAGGGRPATGLAKYLP